MISKLVNIFYCISCGLFFALLQLSYFFLLETFLSAAYTSYFAVILSWLCGSGLGLRIKSPNNKIGARVKKPSRTILFHRGSTPLTLRKCSLIRIFSAVTPRGIACNPPNPLQLYRKFNFRYKEIFLGILSLSCLYLLYFLLNRFAALYLLPFYILLIILSSLGVGYFFRTQRETFRQIKYLFFWENLGFIFGFVLSFLGFIFWGKRLILFGPAVIFLGTVILLGLKIRLHG